MKNDFLIAITQLAAEKRLPREVVLEAVEAALLSAYKKDNLVANQNISVKIVPHSGEVKVFTQKRVTETVTDRATEITLSEARAIMPTAQIGGVVEVESTPFHTGRIAAQTAKQVVLQRLREAERDVVFEEFVDKEGDIISGVVQRIETRQVVIDVGRTEALLPATEQIPNEYYRVGQRVKAYLLEVHRTSKGPQLVVSRTHKNLLRRLFELEVPEIYNGTVELKAIAREPGTRSKVAVTARQEGIDPVGSCVGVRGIRIQNIVLELNGEKIDVIQWHSDMRVFVANALSPAQVLSVEVDEAKNTARVVVPDRQLSLAIGKDGQNARLAAKLTGLRIDIRSATAAEAERAARAMEAEAAAALPEPEAALPAETPASEEAPVAVMAEAVPVETIAAEPVEALGEVPAPVPVGMALEEVVATAPQETTELEEVTVPTAPEPALVIPSKPTIRFAEDLFAPAPIALEGKAKKAKKKREELEGETEIKVKPKKERRERIVYEEDEEAGY